MSTIIAGRFEEQAEVETAVTALRAAGFPADQISSFYLSPPGQHARYALGGDHNVSTGAEESVKGTAAGTTGGGLVGAVIGAATTPLTGPLGAVTGGLVGAHIGNLVGALSKMKDGNTPGEEATPVRHSGFMVAVSTPNPGCEQKAIAVLLQQGAAELESGVGHIVQGDWQDFDPAEPPHRIEPPRAPGMPAG